MVSTVCTGCGVSFSVALKSSTRPLPKYCSRTCFRTTGMLAMRLKGHAALAEKWGSQDSHKKRRTQACEVCGSVIDCKPCRVRRFCGRACSQAVSVRHFTKKERPLCKQCGKLVDRPPASSPRFCNTECFRAWRSDHPELFRGTRTVPCKKCGKILDFKPSDKRKFCNVACSLEYKRASSVPKADGSVVTTNKSTLKWQRSYARKIYNNKCCRCGYDKCPEILQVHHKDFNPRNQDRENLLLLCPNCHEEEHFLTKTGRFGSHTRRKKKYHETYAFMKSASVARLELVESGLPDPGPR